VSGEDSSPAVIFALKARSPCMKKALREAASIFTGRAVMSFLRFFRSAVLVGREEEDKEMRSEHASTAFAATISAMRARAAEAAGLSFGGGWWVLACGPPGGPATVSRQYPWPKRPYRPATNVAVTKSHVSLAYG
jgi:hypothetical protein